VTEIHLTGEYKITAKGHAATPAMCAAISTLLQTIVCWLLNYGKDYSYRLEPGDAEIRFPPGGENDTVFNFAVVGFSQLSATDPENIKIFLEM
jgi:uncharacterized protein YsxB (DUF464 family)